MNGRAFKLGTFAKPDGKPFAAIVLDDSAIDLAQAGPTRPRAASVGSAASIQDLLEDWDRTSPRSRRSRPSSTRMAPKVAAPSRSRA